MQRDLPELEAEIVPGQSAAGVLLGTKIADLAIDGIWEGLGLGVDRLDAGPVTVWVRDGVVEQVGVCAPYSGAVLGGAIGIGSTIGDVVTALGPLVEDAEDTLVSIDVPGVAFETTSWRGQVGCERWTHNLDARITDIFVFRVDSAGKLAAGADARFARAAQRPKTLLRPSSPMINLLAADYAAPGEWLESIPHEHAEGAVIHRHAVPDGVVLITVWQGAVHEVIFQTPCEFEEDSDIRNERLFAFYAEGQEWREIVDNGFGKTYRRADLQRYALWSHAMDFVTFGTMAFHAVKWG